MADILIKGLALPKNYPYRLSIQSDGTVTEHTIGAKATAIELQPHGRLVDIDRIIEILEKFSDVGIPRTNAEVACLLKELAKYWTIVEASNGNNN